MVQISVKIEGIDEVRRQYAELADGLNPALQEAMLRVGARMVEAVTESISTAYPPPSEPGEPPHVRTGALLRSVRIDSSEQEPPSVTVAAGGAGTLVPYAAALEFGTSRMEPRPFMLPAAELVRGEALEIITGHLDSYLDGSLA